MKRALTNSFISEWDLCDAVMHCYRWMVTRSHFGISLMAPAAPVKMPYLCSRHNKHHRRALYYLKSMWYWLRAGLLLIAMTFLSNEIIGNATNIAHERQRRSIYARNAYQFDIIHDATVTSIVDFWVWRLFTITAKHVRGISRTIRWYLKLTATYLRPITTVTMNWLDELSKIEKCILAAAIRKYSTWKSHSDDVYCTAIYGNRMIKNGYVFARKWSWWLSTRP